MPRVEIGREIDYDELEAALVGAAADVGWKAKIKDVYCGGYSLESGEGKNTREYDRTNIKLMGAFLPALSVEINKNRNWTDHFYANSVPPFGVALPFEIRRYLTAVSNRLNPDEQVSEAVAA